MKYTREGIGYFHVDIAELHTAEGKLHLYVAIDRTSKFAFVQLVDKANRKTASAFLEALVAAVPYKINIVLTPSHGLQANRAKGLAGQWIMACNSLGAVDVQHSQMV